MMHFRPEAEKNIHTVAGQERAIAHQDAQLHVEMWQLRVAQARRAADESLLRVQDAPEPHITTNSLFVALFEAHQRDRETLFEAMRQLDAARMYLTSLDLNIAAFAK